MPINLGNPRELSVKEFASVVQKTVGSDLGIDFLPGRPDDPRRRCPDISKAKRLLGWEPKVPVEEGIRLTIEAFRKEL
jgi:nucleoside-diphosphate-sugar epimerase